MAHKFDTKAQFLKYEVLKSVAKYSWTDSLLDHVLDIPYEIVPGRKPTMRCCVYKERAILGERVKIAMGTYKDNPHIIQVIDIACDECPVGGYEITSGCRGCLSHHCKEACRFDAIYQDENHVSHINKEKCKECGMCAKACPYSAIIQLKRPCQNACKVKAISWDENRTAKIDYDKCISCGACSYQCPFGAISDRSFILDLIDIFKQRKENEKVVAVIAPSIGSQFSYAKPGQVITGLRKLGFDEVIEAAFGADVVAYHETKELYEKGFLTSSCCPAFVKFQEINYPEVVPYISHNPSPMAMVGKLVKEKNPNTKVVFIGPCTAKKEEVKKQEVSKYIDIVITFEELQALFDSKEINIEELEETALSQASEFGRGFAKSGGLTNAVKQGLKEIGAENFELKPITCDGIEECNINLLKWSKKISDFNFMEGMACNGGCISGAGCLTHSIKSKAMIDIYSKQNTKSSIIEAVNKKDEVI